MGTLSLCGSAKAVGELTEDFWGVVCLNKNKNCWLHYTTWHYLVSAFLSVWQLAIGKKPFGVHEPSVVAFVPVALECAYGRKRVWKRNYFVSLSRYLN